jgi:hypothetical protein
MKHSLLYHLFDFVLSCLFVNFYAMALLKLQCNLYTFFFLPLLYFFAFAHKFSDGLEAQEFIH